MRYVSNLIPMVVAAALSSACTEEEPAPAPKLTAQVTGDLYFAPGSDWVGAESVKVVNGGEVLCAEERDVGGVGATVEDCEDCDIALDLVAGEPAADGCAFAAETEPDVWIPGRYVVFVGQSSFDGVRFGVLRVSDDRVNWEDWSTASLDGNQLSYKHELELTIEQPEDFEPKDQAPAR